MKSRSVSEMIEAPDSALDLTLGMEKMLWFSFTPGTERKRERKNERQSKIEKLTATNGQLTTMYAEASVVAPLSEEEGGICWELEMSRKIEAFV